MSKIIFLNGCSSSGKTGVARSIQHISSDPWLRFGIDMFIDMIPDEYVGFGDKARDGYFVFEPGTNDQGPTIRVEEGPRGKQVFQLMPQIASLFAAQGNNLIIDEVLFDDECLIPYLKALKPHKVYFIGITCDLAAMQEREILRRDRAIGLANDQINRVHEGLREYDMKVDTTSNAPFDVARKILSFLENTPDPKGFKKMCEILKI